MIMKKIICVIALMLGVYLNPSSISLNAIGINEGRLEYTVVSDSTVCVTGNTLNESISELNIPASVVGPDFKDYNRIKSYSVIGIGERAFLNCTGLISVIIPNSVTSIGERAFYGCIGLTSVTIPNSVTSIGERVFLNCTGLISVIIPNSVISIGEQAFYLCTGLTSVTIPNSVTSIGPSAFYGCTGLTNVIFNAENCKTMGSYDYPVFKNCTNLSSVTIGENVKDIPSYTFSGCNGLTKVIIGSSVKTIGNYAFANIERLAKIYLLNPIPPTCASADIFNKVNKDKCTLYVPLGTAEDYKTTYVWWDFNNIIEKEMSGIEETIADYAEGEQYYNLQGVRVVNPEHGLYIKRQGGKTSKVIL